MKKYSLHIRLIALLTVCVMLLCSCVELPSTGVLEETGNNKEIKKETELVTEEQEKATEKVTEKPIDSSTQKPDNFVDNTQKPDDSDEDNKKPSDDNNNSGNNNNGNTNDNTNDNTDNTPTPPDNNDDGEGTETQICEHSFGEWKITQEPKCLGVPGTQVATCTKCGATKEESVVVEGHLSVVDDPEREATCKQEGLTAGKHCEACGTVIISQTAISLRSHTYTDDEDTTCNVCGNVRDVRCKHTYTTILPAKAATCTESGLSAGETCDKCKEVLVAQTVIPALGHTEQTIKGYAATENDWGLTDGVKCSVCKVVLVEQKAVFPIGYNNIERYVDDYGYKALSQFDNGAKMQNLYNKIGEKAEEFHTDPSLNAVLNGNLYLVATFDYGSLGLTLEEATTVWSFFRHDHPLYYWYSPIFAYDTTNKKICIVTDEAYAKGTDRAEYNKLVFESVRSYVANLQGETSEYRIALALHDLIINNIDYAYKSDGVTPEEALWAHNILGVFEKNSGVCESYAKTFQLLLNYCEVENIYVTGLSQNQSHAWNMVMMDDGKWYWFDLTWDDRPGWMWGISYNYFCVSAVDNVSWIDGPWIQNSAMTFSQSHAPFNLSSAGVNRQYELPAVSTASIDLDIAMLRDTFEVGGLKYAVVGYNALQLVGASGISSLVIPQTVRYGGAEYKVISIGAIKDKLLKDGAIEITDSQITSVQIPESVVFIWDSALNINTVAQITVDADNPVYTSQSGVLFTKSLYTLVQYPLGSTAKEYAIPDETVELAHSGFGTGSIGALRKLTLGRSLTLVGTLNAGYGYRNSSNAKILNVAQGDFFYISEFMNLKGEICLHEQNEGFVIEDGGLYDKDRTILHVIVDRSITSFTCEETVRMIDVGAFFYCSALKELTLYTTLENICSYAFGYCNIRTLYFEGSAEEWDSISKQSQWKYFSTIGSIEYKY